MHGPLQPMMLRKCECPGTTIGQTSIDHLYTNLHWTPVCYYQLQMGMYGYFSNPTGTPMESLTATPIYSSFQTMVLIIGGGDGGVLREVLKHQEIEQVDQCEIDGKVIEVCKKYLPNMASSFDDKKLKLHIGDGFEYMKNHQGEYDVIITDSSDPIGPAASLFEKSYYELMKKALKPDGLLSCQGECIWLHLDLIKGMLEFCRSLYPVTDYAYTSIPTYPSGQIGFVLCSKNPDTNFREPARKWTQSQINELNLRYYNTAIHRNSFVLPEFARKVLDLVTDVVPI